jgi:heme-degrading monooxygenase HmoA
MHVIIWSFQAKAGLETDFERVYGPDGAWARLFRNGAGYLRTDLMRDLDTPGHYLILDWWDQPESFHAFRRQWETEYLALDRQCDNVRELEVSIGSFVTVDSLTVPACAG